MKCLSIAGCGALCAMFFISGCVMRTSTYQADRVDQEIKGNRGFLMGTPPPAEETDVKKTREMYNLEVELPSLYQKKSARKRSETGEDKKLYGNRGYVTGNVSGENSGGGTVRLGGFGATQSPQVIYSESVKGEYANESSPGAESYIVEKNDTLQKISQKMYGTTKKWKKIYNANKGALKSPDRIRPGQKLLIPKE